MKQIDKIMKGWEKLQVPALRRTVANITSGPQTQNKYEQAAKLHPKIRPLNTKGPPPLKPHDPRLPTRTQKTGIAP